MNDDVGSVLHVLIECLAVTIPCSCMQRSDSTARRSTKLKMMQTSALKVYFQIFANKKLISIIICE